MRSFQGMMNQKLGVANTLPPATSPLPVPLTKAPAPPVLPSVPVLMRPSLPAPVVAPSLPSAAVLRPATVATVTRNLQAALGPAPLPTAPTRQGFPGFVSRNFNQVSQHQPATGSANLLQNLASLVKAPERRETPRPQPAVRPPGVALTKAPQSPQTPQPPSLPKQPNPAPSSRSTAVPVPRPTQSPVASPPARPQPQAAPPAPSPQPPTPARPQPKAPMPQAVPPSNPAPLGDLKKPIHQPSLAATKQAPKVAQSNVNQPVLPKPVVTAPTEPKSTEPRTVQAETPKTESGASTVKDSRTAPQAESSRPGQESPRTLGPEGLGLNPEPAPAPQLPKLEKLSQTRPENSELKVAEVQRQQATAIQLPISREQLELAQQAGAGLASGGGGGNGGGGGQQGRRRGQQQVQGEVEEVNSADALVWEECSGEDTLRMLSSELREAIFNLRTPERQLGVDPKPVRSKRSFHKPETQQSQHLEQEHEQPEQQQDSQNSDGHNPDSHRPACLETLALLEADPRFISYRVFLTLCPQPVASKAVYRLRDFNRFPALDHRLRQAIPDQSNRGASVAARPA